MRKNSRKGLIVLYIFAMSLVSIIGYSQEDTSPDTETEDPAPCHKDGIWGWPAKTNVGSGDTIHNS